MCILRIVPIIGPMKVSDDTLIQAIGAGNREAFDALVERYGKRLFNFIYRYLGERGESEDLTQEVFLRVFLSAGRFEARPGISASTWIYKIAYHLSLNEIKRRRRFLQLSMDLKHCGKLENYAPPEDEPFETENRETLLRGLRILPENQRAALLLRVNEGLSYQEICDVLGVSLSSVTSLLFRARQTLREYFKRIEE